MSGSVRADSAERQTPASEPGYASPRLVLAGAEKLAPLPPVAFQQPPATVHVYQPPGPPLPLERGLAPSATQVPQQFDARGAGPRHNSAGQNLQINYADGNYVRTVGAVSSAADGISLASGSLPADAGPQSRLRRPGPDRSTSDSGAQRSAAGIASQPQVQPMPTAPRQRALLPESTSPLKLNPTDDPVGIFQWPEGMRAKSVETPPEAESPMAKRSKALFRPKGVVTIEPVEGTPGSDVSAAVPPAPATSTRPRAIFAQRDDGRAAPLPVAAQTPPQYVPQQSPVAQDVQDLVRTPPVAAQEQSANIQPSAANTHSRALFSTAPQLQSAEPSPIERFLGPGVLPPKQAPDARALFSVAAATQAVPVSNDPMPAATPPGLKKAKALFPKAMWTRFRSNESSPPEPDPLAKFLPKNYTPAGQNVDPRSQSSAGPAGGAKRSKALFSKPLQVQAPPIPTLASPPPAATSQRLRQSPAVAAVNPPETVAASLHSEPFEAVAEPAEQTVAAPAGQPGKSEATMESPAAQWRPSKRRVSEITAAPAEHVNVAGKEEPKSEAKPKQMPQPKPTETVSRTSSEQVVIAESVAPLQPTTLTIERPAKSQAAVIVSVVEHSASADVRPTSDDTIATDTALSEESKAEVDSPVKRSGSNDASPVGEPAEAEAPRKRRPVIIEREKSDDSQPKRSSQVWFRHGSTSSGPVLASSISRNQENEAGVISASVAQQSGAPVRTKPNRGSDRMSEIPRKNPLR